MQGSILNGLQGVWKCNQHCALSVWYIFSIQAIKLRSTGRDVTAPFNTWRHPCARRVQLRSQCLFPSQGKGTGNVACEILQRSLRKQPSFFAPGLHAKRHSGRERRRTAVFAGYWQRGCETFLTPFWQSTWKMLFSTCKCYFQVKNGFTPD